jgi:hypothetical protein
MQLVGLYETVSQHHIKTRVAFGLVSPLRLIVTFRPTSWPSNDGLRLNLVSRVSKSCPHVESTEYMPQLAESYRR